MRQITLRGIPSDIESIVQKEAKVKGMSLNKAFLALLRKGADLQSLHRVKKARVKSEFSSFLGLWEKDEAADFDASLKEQRLIDKELWP